MNKITFIIIATILAAGIGYQAKRQHDAGKVLFGDADQNGKSSQPGQNKNENNTGVANNTSASGSLNPQGTNSAGETVDTTHPAMVGAEHATDSQNGHPNPAVNGANQPGAVTAVNQATDAGHAQNGQSTSQATTGTSNSAIGKSVSTAQHTASGTTAGAAGTATGAAGAVSGAVGANHTATSPSAHTSETKKVAAKAEPEKPKDNCFAFEYRHKKEAKDQEIENFLDYTNAFPLLHPNFNEKSICVKVNQKVVAFQMSKYKSAPEVRVSGMVGPESVVRVSYCVGKVSPCHETCVQPKKRFMDDLMSDAGDDDSFSDSWGNGDEKRKKDLKDKSKEMRAIASENDHLNDSTVQRDWEDVQKQEWVCK